jgi:MFS transporter, ACS family, glucarate transporter
MNTGANLGGALSPTLTPWMADQWGWPTALAAAGAVAMVGAILWLKVDPAQNLDGHAAIATGDAPLIDSSR